MVFGCGVILPVVISLLCLSTSHEVQCAQIPPTWVKYLEELTKREKHYSVVVSPPLPHDLWVDGAQTESYILPHVLLWNPIAQHLCRDSCPLKSCPGSLSMKCWKIGQSSSLQPRTLHDIDHSVMLVSALYSCSMSHELASTDPRLLEKLRSIHIPFILLHKTGFMRSFMNNVISLVSHGMTFNDVEDFITERRQQHATTLAMQSQKSDDICISSSTFVLISKPIPSNDILCKCFLVDFFENRESYNLHMSQVQVEKYISIDHTFKVASNIGYVRADGNWVTLYSSVFIVMNEKGQVISWEFSKSTSLDDVISLHNVKDFQCKKWLPPHTIFVDACCSQRNKLVSVFGQGTIVKLDIFHALQRVKKKLPKRHPFYSDCLKDLRMIVRCPTDTGEIRKMSTPSPGVILQQCNNFIKKWQSCESNGWSILNSAALKEINSLKVHIQKGCLSDICPGGGTNRNEALHRHIRPHFSSRSRIGLPLALALLTIVLYRYNTKIEGKISGKRVNSTTSLLVNKSSCITPPPWYGLNQRDTHGNEISWVVGPSLDMDLLDASLMQEGDISLDEDVLEVISIDDMHDIIENSINLSKIASAMQKQSYNSPAFNYKFFPLMSSVTSIYFNSKLCDRDSTSSLHDERLENVLKSWGMKRVAVDGDGNCCFSAVAFALRANAEKIKEHRPNFFHEHGLQTNTLESLSTCLRYKTVEEWQSHPSDYEGFAPGIDVAHEANKFLESGYFHGDLADTIVLALSNFLQLPFIVFSSIAQQPVISITPRQSGIPLPLHIAFNQYGAGHYDACIGCEDKEPKTDQKQHVCTCGKNDKANKTHCHPVTYKYTTRSQCICHKQNRPCNILCLCYRCKNPFGEKKIEPIENKRKRPRHHWQQHFPKSVKFAIDAGESINFGSRSLLEFFIFESILKYLVKEGIDINVENIDIIYNAIYKSLAGYTPQLPVGPKTSAEINCFIKEHNHNLELYRALCLSHLHSTCM